MAHRPKRLDGSYALMVAGPGVPAGGLEGQFAKKNSDVDYDIVWARIAFINLTGLPSDNDALSEVLAQKSSVGHTHDDRYYRESEVDTIVLQLETADEDLDARVTALENSVALQALPLTFNFTDDANAYFMADVAMTVTEQGTQGAGSIDYEKSTAAAPTVFSSTTSPVTLEAGAWLKVVATGEIAVHLKRTA